MAGAIRSKSLKPSISKAEQERRAAEQAKRPSKKK